jgi:hypothetical protein
MRAIIFCSVLMLGLVGCGNKDKAGAPPVAAEMPAQLVPPKPVIDHYYVMHDGAEYGYESAISDNAKSNGQIAAKLLMLRYAGSRDGKYQVYTTEKGITTSMECENPCEYIKVMVFSNDTHLQTERIRATEGALGWYVMQDAINGKLNQSMWRSNDKKVTKNIWFSEKGGMQLTLQKDPA